MALECKYTKDEVLMIIGEHACKTLPKKNGVIRARFEEDGSIRIVFIEDENQEQEQEEPKQINKNLN